MIIIILCGVCSKEIKKPIYKAGYLGYLCGQHAKEHGLMEIASIDHDIEYLQKKKYEINAEWTKAFQNDCEHKWIDTGYGSIGEDKVLKSLCRCEKCGLSEYKEDGQI